MKFSLLFGTALFSLSLALHPAQAEPAPSQPEKIIPATLPTENTRHWVPARYKEVKRQLQNNPCDLFFVGDSITEGWEREGKQLWTELFLPLKAVNFGISGDRTDHVLWRMKDTKLATTTPPKYCVVLLGTNNIGTWKGRQKTDDIVKGISEVCRTLAKKFPSTKIILMAVTPYGSDLSSPLRKQQEELNLKLRSLKLPKTTFLSLNDKLLNPDGTQKKEYFRDNVHLTAAGYKVWADALLPLVNAK